jgi:hypothetical protein
MRNSFAIAAVLALVASGAIAQTQNPPARPGVRSRSGEPSHPLSAGSPIRRRLLDRGNSATHQRSGGSDPRIRGRARRLTASASASRGAGGRGSVFTLSWNRDPPFGGTEITGCSCTYGVALLTHL